MTHVRPGNRVYRKGAQSSVQPPGDREITDNSLPSTVQRFHGACPPNTTTDDREAGSGSSTEVAGAHRLYPNCLQCNTVLGDRVLALLPNVWKAAPATH